MTDTARTQSALIALCPDNASGAISPQDLRDLIVSTQIHGPGVYRDALGNARALSQTGSAVVNEDFRNTGLQMSFLKSNTDTWIQNEFQFNHDWSATGAVYPHIHYVPCGTSGTVTFRVTTMWALAGRAMGTAASAITTSYSLALTAGTKYIPAIKYFATCTVPTAATASSILIVKLQRRASSDANDTYQGAKDHGTTTANLGALYVDVHYVVTRTGTETQ